MPTTGIHNLYDNYGEYKGEYIVYPEFDIANLGKSRAKGVAWICGDFIEILSSSSSFLYGIAPPKGETKAKKKEDPEDARKRAAQRAKKQIRRIVNFNRLTTMWTLTLAPAESKHASKYIEPIPIELQSNYHFCRCVWKNFIRRIKSEYPQMRWLCVFEIHNSKKSSDLKRGTYHFHMAVDTFVEWNKMGELWRYGNVRFDDFSAPLKERGGKVRNPGAYMGKYVGKGFDVSEKNRKRYTKNRLCRTPKSVSLPELYRTIPDLHTYPVVYQTKKEFEFFDENTGMGGVYGVEQTTYHKPSSLKHL